MPLKTRLHLKTTLLLMLAGIMVCLAFGLYQRFNTGQERLHHDRSRIEAMLSENDAERP